MGGILLFSFCVHAAGPYEYTSLEPIPGSQDSGSNLATYLQAIYKFAIWTVSIAAILMITIGGFMYMVSAGNTSKMDTAKRVVTDAVIGLVVALGAYLLLYVINPDLVKINIVLKPLGSGMSTGVSQPTTSGGGGSGKCKPVASGPCSVENLKGTCFGNNAEKASSICNAESGGKETLGSSVDKCRPGGEVVSWGLFQFNLTANRMNGLNCPSAFNKMYTGTNKDCSITNQSLYSQCVAAAKSPDSNMQAACSLSKSGTKWSAWGANRICGF